MAEYKGSLSVMSGIAPEGKIPVVAAKDVWVESTGGGQSDFKSLADVLDEGIGTGGADNSQQFEKLKQDVAEHGASIEIIDETLGKKADADAMNQALAAKADADAVGAFRGAGENSLVQSSTNDASGKQAVALGYGNKVYAESALGEGRGNTIKEAANGAHGEGGWNTIGGIDSHGEGQTNTVGDGATAAHVEGMSNHALHSRSHVEGLGNKSSRADQHVSGKYNADNAKAAVIVGNGDADKPNADEGLKGRSNAYELDWDGNAMFAGKVTCSVPNPTYDATATPDEPALLRGYAVTEEYVAKIVAGLVGSAPGALDALDELAAALGNDPNFATTMVNALAKKANATTMASEIERLENQIGSLTGSSYDDSEIKQDIQTLFNQMSYKPSTTYVDNKISAIPKLPTVTTADNGKFLRVESGVWKATTIAYAEGVYF